MGEKSLSIAQNSIANEDWSNYYPENPFKLNPEIIYKKAIKPGGILYSEDLRDALSNVPKQPTPEERLTYIGYLQRLGITEACVGVYSGEDNKVNDVMKEVIKAMASNYPDMTPTVLSLTTNASLKWTGELVQLNPKLKAVVFRGTGNHRMLVEEWDEEQILEDFENFIQKTVLQGVGVIAATEHTTQTTATFLETIIQKTIKAGADEFCIADTIGISDPSGAYNIVSFTKKVLQEMNRADVMVHWHGHNDMGLAIPNTIAALMAGADRIHTTAYGIGERAGNVSMEAILLYIHKLLEKSGYKYPGDISNLWGTLEYYCEITGVETPSYGPLSANSMRTQLGIHANAIKNAHLLAEAQTNPHDNELFNKMAQTIYIGYDPSIVGLEPIIEVGPWSGRANVELVAKNLGYNTEMLTPKQIQTVLDYAKEKSEVLTDEEIKLLLDG